METGDRILIIGSGALANYFAARFSNAAIPVKIWGTWPAGLAAIEQNGVIYHDQTGVAHTFSVEVVPSKEIPVDTKLALVVVKSWQTERVAQQLKLALAPDGVALTLQNGLGNFEKLSDVLGPERVAVGVTTAGATLLGPGRVRWGGSGQIVLGKHPAQKSLAAIFSQAGFRTNLVRNTPALLWGKVLINAAINPPTALFRVKNGELLTSEFLLTLMAGLAREVYAITRRLDLPLDITDPVQTVVDVAHKTAGNRSSMLQDVLRGAPTEIDAICGAVVAKGQKIGVATPLNQIMRHLITGLLEE
jgi:2-dehydropantoate 2-reductase